MLRSLILALVLPVATPVAADPWYRARTEHFDLFTNTTPDEARAAASALERFRRVLGRLLPPSRSAAPAPVAVLAFKDSGSFEPVVPLGHGGEPRSADGFFQGGTGRTYIAVNLGTHRPDRYDALYHEWAHLALNEALPAQPAWVGEGLAEVYSAWRSEGDRVLVGLPRPEHLQTIAVRGLMPLEAMLRADYTSDLYNKERPRELFYAQAWAFAHHLLLGRTDGHVRLRAYLDGIARGLDPVEGYRAAFGEDLATAQARLQAHVAPGLVRPAATAVPDDAAPVALTLDAPTRAETQYVLGDLLLHAGRARDARARLARSLEADPSFHPAREALVEVALRQAKWDEARGHLRAALAADPESPVALHRFADAMVREASARSLVLSEDEEAEAVRALEKCVARAPYHADAVHLLARLRPAPVHRRIPLLQAAFLREPHRTELGITLAHLYAKANDLGRSTATLLRAREAARDEAMRFLCSHLLGKAAYVASVTAETQGTLRALECLPGGGLNFLIEGPGGSVLRLHAPSPRAAFLYGPEGEVFERELVCGPQAEPVTAWYRPVEPGAAPGDGTLLSLSFPRTSSATP